MGAGGVNFRVLFEEFRGSRFWIPVVGRAFRICSCNRWNDSYRSEAPAQHFSLHIQAAQVAFPLVIMSTT